MDNTNENKRKKGLYITIVVLLIVFIIAAYKLGKIIHFNDDDSLIYMKNNILEQAFNNKIFTNIDSNQFVGMINVYQKDINVTKDTLVLKMYQIEM